MTADDLKQIIEQNSDVRYLKFISRQKKEYWVKQAELDTHSGNKITLKVTDEFPERHYILQTLRLFLGYFSDAELLVQIDHEFRKISNKHKFDENHTIIIYEDA